jgi:sulfatase maturation enzyme AslB (radical SAM superfamily)
MAVKSRTASNKNQKNKADSGLRAGGKAAPFYFQRQRGGYLLTNDFGHFAKISDSDFQRLLTDKVSSSTPLWRELQAKGFLREHLDFESLTRDFRAAHSYLFRGPGLHILVTTLRCNHSCVYCQSSAERVSRTDTDMSLDTAQKAVDLAFQSPNPSLTIEFQGGEPLLNWPVVEFVIRYARARGEAEKRELRLALVSNLSLLDEAKLKVLFAHEVSLCTSLDGPPGLHDRNRNFLGGSSHERVVRWLKEIRRRYEKEQGPGRKIFKPSALMTKIGRAHV